MRSKITLAGLFFSVVGTILASLLVCKHVFPGLCESSFGCTIDGVDGCDQLGGSKYSKVFGLSIASLGLLFYSTLTVLWAMLWKLRDDLKSFSTVLAGIFFLSAFGFVVDVVLAYVNFTVLLVPCLLCVYTYIATFLIFFAAILIQWTGPVMKDITFQQTAMKTLIGLAGGLVMAIVIHGCLAVFHQPDNGKSALLPPDQTERVLEELNALKQVNIGTNGLTAAGADEGYIIIHEFADFLCPHCKHASESIALAKKRWPGRIKTYYRHFPLDGSCNSAVGQSRQPVGDWRCNAAQAAICAEQDSAYENFYHGIFELQKNNPPIIGLAQLETVAKKTGADWNQIVNCMGSARMKARLDQDIKDAMSLEIRSTPTIVLNGKLLPAGAPDTAYFLAMIDSLVYKKEGQKAYDEFAERVK